MLPNIHYSATGFSCIGLIFSLWVLLQFGLASKTHTSLSMAVFLRPERADHVARPSDECANLVIFAIKHVLVNLKEQNLGQLDVSEFFGITCVRIFIINEWMRTKKKTKEFLTPSYWCISSSRSSPTHFEQFFYPNYANDWNLCKCFFFINYPSVSVLFFSLSVPY